MLNLPVTVFGLAAGADTAVAASSAGASAGPIVGRAGPLISQEDDAVRRRAFLLAAGLAGIAAARPGTPALAVGQVDPARLLAHELGTVLLEPVLTAEPADITVLRRRLAAAQQEFSACEYVPLATRLPDLIAAAEATAQDATPGAQHTLAQVYNLATRALVKLEASGLEWVAADRGLRAARAAGEPLTMAESHRLIAGVARRAGDHDRAQSLTLAAADILDIHGPHPEPDHLAMYAKLHCSAGYAAACSGDRDTADLLLAEADTIAPRLIGQPRWHRAVVANSVSHRVSAADLLGDAGAALRHAHRLPLAAVPTVERRARLLVDIAMAYAHWDKPHNSVEALLHAEHIAPGEVRTRNTARRLVSDLMTHPAATRSAELHALAARIHATPAR